MLCCALSYVGSSRCNALMMQCKRIEADGRKHGMGANLTIMKSRGVGHVVVCEVAHNSAVAMNTHNNDRARMA